jgi:phosphohistidine phosphatase
VKLYLAQHAKAKSKEEDLDRPLTEQGWLEVKKVAAAVENYPTININNIYHSGKTRARQTAEVFAEHLKPGDGIHETAGLEPMADTTIWYKRLDDISHDIMLIGHLPHLNKLTSRLLAKDEEKWIIAFQNAGVVCLEKNGTGAWALRWMVTPDIIE